MANLVAKVKSLYEKEQQQSLSWLDRIERLEVKKKNSLRCVALCIFTGIKEQSNTSLWMMAATPNFSLN